MKRMNASLKERPSDDRGSSTGAAWGQERRLEFIEFRLLWDGKINRGELVDFFRTSIQQASLDIARYIELAPGNLAYDKRQKVYKACPKLHPVLTQRDSLAFLDQLAGLSGAASTTNSFIGWRPPSDVVRYPTRSIRPEILMRVLWAIRDHQDIEVFYQSMRQPAATRRWIAPHAIAHDGDRWHVRAWCHQHGYFKDFVFARMQQIYGARLSEIDGSEDERWNSFTAVVLRARGSLSESQRIAVETEFGMRAGTLEVKMREALVFYFVRRLGLFGKAHDSDGVLLELVNADKVEPLIAEAASR